MLPNFTFERERAQLFRIAGCDISQHVSLQGRLTLAGGHAAAGRLHIDEGAIISPNTTIWLDADVTIGRDVSVGPGTLIHTGTHMVGFGSRRMTPNAIALPIVIEERVSVGMFSIILPGVTLRHGSVVSPGSVVSHDVPANALVAGNPATIQQINTLRRDPQNKDLDEPELFAAIK